MTLKKMSVTTFLLIASAASAQALTVYTTFTREQVAELATEFQKVEPTIKLDFFRAAAEEVSNTFMTEMERGVTKADYVTGNVDYLKLFAKEGYLTSYQPPGVSDMLPGTTDPDGYWVPTHLAVTGIVYNTRVVSEADAPKSFRDLLDPKWKGKLGMTDPRTTGSIHPPITNWTTTLKDRYGEPPFGWSYVASILDQDARVVTGHRQLLDLLVSGEISVAVSAPSGQVGPFFARGEPLKIIWPEEGVTADMDGGAIVRDTPNMEDARKFHDFIASEAGQRFIAETWKTGSAHKNVPSVAPDGTPFSELKFTTIAVSPALRAEQAKKFSALIDAR